MLALKARRCRVLVEPRHALPLVDATSEPLSGLLVEGKSYPGSSTARLYGDRPRSRRSGPDPLTRGSAQFAQAADSVEVDQTGAGAGAGARDLDGTLTDGLYVEA